MFRNFRAAPHDLLVKLFAEFLRGTVENLPKLLFGRYENRPGSSALKNDCLHDCPFSHTTAVSDCQRAVRHNSSEHRRTKFS